ncbi:MAG TPA: nuclear transport factor 2 family protein [Ensifer sp.]|jgi:ketosteroid isomerase-like protein|uniref:nuclear transport factor 2 family protein n=1 Tax=Ensifer sp. TaxID=1872086 RepID=UPI002E11C077|nr:nuclear transport factor 2 family protein [Ensifer sp.]
MAERIALEQTVRDLYLARNANDLDAIMKLLAQDFTFQIVGSGRLGPLALAVNTQETVRGTFQDLIDAWDLNRLETVGIYVDGDTVVAHRAGPIVFRPSKTEIQTHIIDKFTFRDGRVAAIEEFVDTLLVAETIGLLGEPDVYSSSTRDRISL